LEAVDLVVTGSFDRSDRLTMNTHRRRWFESKFHSRLGVIDVKLAALSSRRRRGRFQYVRPNDAARLTHVDQSPVARQGVANNLCVIPRVSLTSHGVITERSLGSPELRVNLWHLGSHPKVSVSRVWIRPGAATDGRSGQRTSRARYERLRERKRDAGE